jgi:ATP-binding cassette subfamily B protein
MFLFFLGQLYGPLQGMTRIADWLSRAMTAAERVFEILDTEPDVADAADAVPLPHVRGEIEFHNVSFHYDPSRRVVENLELHVRPGEMIGLVGHSGAGKTTIINLISRFYDPVEGTVLVDGVDMRRVRVNDLRRQLGVVLQEPFLFPGTVAENISYAKPEATPEEIMRAAKAANAHDFIMRFPDGYDTQVGERGTRLSGGERQRLSIARAVLHDPRILILDEATASVDTETEKQIQEAIARLIRDRTTFAIAHRLSTLRNADRLLVMDKGKIVELGTHDELMAKPEGVFRRLVEMQTEINQLRAL